MLGAIYWDPDPTLFVLPIVDHPIRWYGILFALGFLVAYALVVRILREYFNQYPAYTADQILDWKGVIGALRRRGRDDSEIAALVLAKLDDNARKSVDTWKEDQEPSESVKSAVLAAMNAAVFSFGPNEQHRKRERLDLVLRSAISSLTGMAYRMADRLAVYAVIGTIAGARLGHVFFYEWARYQNNWLGIFKIWEGGLASHGGAVGVILAILAFRLSVKENYPWLTALVTLDMAAIVTGFVGFCIRFGNFVNQEILGTPSELPWAVIFGHPIDGSTPIARHPVQLYEGLVYLALFLVMFSGWKRCKTELRSGCYIGWFLIVTFTARFFLEFLKVPQSQLIGGDASILMGQWLSVPFVILGVLFLLYAGQWRGNNSGGRKMLEI